MISTHLIRKITEVDPQLREILLLILEEIEKQRAQWEESVTKTEFNELKEIVQDLARKISKLTEAQEKTEVRLNQLAEAQKQTEARLNQLTEAQKQTEARLNQLTEAQKQTEVRLNQLAEAQKQTEFRVNKLVETQEKMQQQLSELVEAQKKTEKEIAKLTRGLSRTRKDLGGLSRSVAYALENEAYRHLPSLLEKRFQIKLLERLIRTSIENEEINIFGKGRQNGKDIFLVGEAVLKLDDTAKLRAVWKKVQLVKEQFGVDVVPILVTHFAKPSVLEKAQKAGIIVVQSFEWI
ncbi:MAG: hypothetical protein JRI45_07105 [Deltaproteobacteria bacterium]|nr:hypothetical protein [Deltaproteobacteria bacterium]MBW2067978.1 hypothetical protein [Deltaproteobacteria bacterium]